MELWTIFKCIFIAWYTPFGKMFSINGASTGLAVWCVDGYHQSIDQYINLLTRSLMMHQSINILIDLHLVVFLVKVGVKNK